METNIDTDFQDPYTVEDVAQALDPSSNGQDEQSSSNQHQQRAHRGGLKGSRSRIRFHPYKGIGTRTYTNSVFVSNIPYELSEEGFKELFEKEVGKVLFCEIFPEPGGLSTGCGVIEFENASDVDVAVYKMKKYQIQGRGLVVRDDRNLNFSSRYRQPPAVVQTPSIVNRDILCRLNVHPEDVSETVHIANLSEEVDLRKLKDVFSLAGLVMNLEILKDEQGKSLGLATVTYSSSEEAVNAISMFDNQSLFDAKLSVRMDKGKKRLQEPDRQTDLPLGLGSIGQNLLTKGQQGGGAGASMGMPMMGGAMGGAMGSAMGGAAMGGGAMGGGAMGGGAMGGRPMGGFGGDLNSGMGGNFDRQMGGMGRGFDMGSGYPSETPLAYGAGFGGGPMRNYGYGSHSGGDSPSGSQVFVRNLAPEVTWEDLKDAFKNIGRVYYADVKTDSDGKSKCYGTVKFHNPHHAQQAIVLLNGANLKGRRIGVTMGRF